MEANVIKAEKRDASRKGAKRLRREGILPAVIYGKGIEPVAISLEQKEATQTLKNTSSSTLLTVEVDGTPYTTLVRERQRDFIRGDYLHIDFLAVSLTEKVRANVRLVLEGEAPALKKYDCLVITGIEEIEVESLPQDLPDRILVDMTILEEIGEGIYVRDLTLPPNVEVLEDEGEMIAVISAQVVEEEEEEEVAAVEEGEEPELVERGEEEEEGEEEEG